MATDTSAAYGPQRGEYYRAFWSALNVDYRDWRTKRADTTERADAVRATRWSFERLSAELGGTVFHFIPPRLLPESLTVFGYRVIFDELLHDKEFVFCRAEEPDQADPAVNLEGKG
jgi:hypothetical protein